MNDSVTTISTVENTSYSIYLPDNTTDFIEKQIEKLRSCQEQDMLYNMLAHSNEGDLIVDIGSNLGNSTIFLAHQRRNVIAFEPNKTLFQSIEKSIAINSLQNRVEVFNYLISNQDEVTSVNPSDTQDLEQSQIDEGIEAVKISSLHEFINGRVPKLIKIDLEGLQSEILKGAEKIIYEFHPDLYIRISKIESLESILKEECFHDYVYVETFHPEPIHRFVHKNRLPPDEGFVIFSNKAGYSLILGANDLSEQIQKSKSENQSLINSLLAEKKSNQQKIENLTHQKKIIERELKEHVKQSIFTEKKLRDRLKKTIKIGIVLGLPVIILTSPAIILIIAAKYLNKSFKNRRLLKSKRNISIALKQDIRSKTNDEIQQYEPKQLSYKYSTPSLGQPKENHSDRLVSIVVPSFNNHEFLGQAINSVLAQTYHNVEVIVVDDGSGDTSVSTAAEIATHDPRVKIIPLLRNFGCYYARNVGIMHARGDYIGLCDSDDILAPDFVKKSVNTLERNFERVACQSRLRRWTSDFSTPVSHLRYGEITLLWRRSILQDIGWYDTCRFAADTEFRQRIIVHYGKSAIVQLPDECYFARTISGSLTMSELARAHTLQDGTLKNSLSTERKKYVENFTSWHARLESKPILDFPQFNRPFELGSAGQNASPSLAQSCIGAMASYPKRHESLRLALPPLLNQFDRIFLYLNDYDVIPDFCMHPKLTVTLSNEAEGDLRDNGKFYDLPDDENTYIFTLDDDILYPDDYVRKMIHYLEVFERKVVVGVHGVIFPEEPLFDLKQREVAGFHRKSSGGFVDLLGTGTTAWHSSILKPRLQDFRSTGLCDLWFARLAALSDVPMFSVPRDAKWLVPIDGNEGSLFDDAMEGRIQFLDVYERFLEPILKDKKIRSNALHELIEKYSAPAVAAFLGEFWLGR